jgi:hypothetical protein
MQPVTLSRRQTETLLAWCNRVRGRIGAPATQGMRKGKRNEVDSCALANTINYRVTADDRVRVDEQEVYRGEDAFAPDEVIAKTPRYAERFIREFDRGEHEELVGRGWS